MSAPCNNLLVSLWLSVIVIAVRASLIFLLICTNVLQDPRFACETYEAMASTVPDASVSLIIAGTTQTKVKRRVPTGAPTLAVPESDLNSVISRSPSPEPEPMLPAKCVCVTSPCPCDGSDNSLNFKEKRDSGVGVNNGVTSGNSGVVMKDKRDYGSGTGVNNGLTTDEEGTLPFMEKRKANVEITISVTIKF